MKRFLRVLLALLAIVFAVVTFMPGARNEAGRTGLETVADAEPSEEIHPAPTPEDVPDDAEYCWVRPDGFLLSEEDAAKNWTKDDSLKIYYPLDSVKHTVYIFPDEYGLFNLENDLSFEDLGKAIAVLSVNGEALPYTDEQGSEAVTLGTLISILAEHYKAPEKSFEFSDLSAGDPLYIPYCIAVENGWIEYGEDVSACADKILTRGDFVILLNKVLSRTPAENINEELTGPILDIDKNDKLYAQFAEAAIEHEHEDGLWTESVPVEKQDEGFSYLHNRLCYIDESGHLLKSGEAEGFLFDENGYYTSGNPELDELARSVLDKVVDDSMNKEEKLRAIYDHMMSEDYNYRKGNNYVIRYTGWYEEEALKLFTTGKGNCYSYAAAFCELCRSIGYDAQVYSGFFGVEQQFHGWTEITIDEEPYICDPEMQMSYWRTWKEVIDMYMLSYEQAVKWNYVH